MDRRNTFVEDNLEQNNSGELNRTHGGRHRNRKKYVRMDLPRKQIVDGRRCDFEEKNECCTLNFCPFYRFCPCSCAVKSSKKGKYKYILPIVVGSAVVFSLIKIGKGVGVKNG